MSVLDKTHSPQYHLKLMMLRKKYVSERTFDKQCQQSNFDNQFIGTHIEWVF